MVFLFSQEYYDQLRRIASKFSRSSLREKVINVVWYSIYVPLPSPLYIYRTVCVKKSTCDWDHWWTRTQTLLFFWPVTAKSRDPWTKGPLKEESHTFACLLPLPHLRWLEFNDYSFIFLPYQCWHFIFFPCKEVTYCENLRWLWTLIYRIVLELCQNLHLILIIKIW